MKILFSAVLLFAALVCASAQTSTEQDRFREAEGRFASRNYGAALSLYDSFIREFPLSRYAPDAQFRKGICYYRLGRLNDSFAAFDLVRERFAATRFYGYLPFWQGLVLFDWGRFGEAAEYLDRYIKTGTEASPPEFLAEALQYRGRALAVLGQDDEARRELAKLLSYDNRNASIRSGLLLLASLYLKAGSPRQALDVLERLEADIIAGENPLTGYLYMAEALRGLGRLFEAEVMYREVIDGAAGNSDPSSVSAAFKRLFTLYENAGRDQDLENLLFQAEKLLSPYPEILSEFWLSAGIDYFRQNRFDLSASYFRRILSLEGTTPVPGSVYLYLAYNYEKQGQAQQAMRILEEALAKSGDGDGKEILLKLADLKLRSKLYGDAALLYESYLSRFGSAGAAGASYSLGFCYTALGDFTKARAVLESALKYGESSNLLPGIYRLLAIVYKQQRDEKNLKSCLEQYLGLLPGDREARLEYISLIFGQGDYLLTAEQIEALYSAEPALRQKDTPGSAKPAYLYGLSKIGTKRYEEAFVSLAGMGPPDSYKNQADKNFVQSVYAGLVYYRGWALYRLSRFSEAEKEFAFYLKTFPAGANTAKVNYYAGWCSYSLGDFPKAGVYFHAAALVMKDGGLFMEAKSLAAAGELTRAAVLFRTLSTQFPSSALKDDAVFEEASVLAEMEKADESASLFLTLHANLAAAAARTPGQPPNPLMEESLYRRAEVLFGAGKYVEARNAYYDYRLKYPNGKFMDVSLYSGGAASMKLSEPFAALLLWEKLAAEFPQSGYRSEALRQTAEIYKARQEYVKALAVFREVTAQYPETAKLYRLDVEISALELMLSGKSAEEAQLTARISNLRGAETREGREAMLSLARYYLAQGPSGLESALGVLTRIVEREQSDTVSSAKARYLLGEYYFRKGELKQAAAEFFTAAGTNPADADLSASALYRAAEILLDAGYRTDAADIIGIISAKYPGTVWEAEGSRLLGVKK